MEGDDEVKFRTSSFTTYDYCVEVGDCKDGARLVRNSKDRGGPVLRFTEPEWDAFIKGVKAGEFG